MTHESKNGVPRQLREVRKRYTRVKSRMSDVGFICEGSLVVRWTQCGKPNCRCQNDPARRHGPYYQLSWKEKGKTVSRRLSPEHARLYEKWIDNRRLLEAILEQMREASREAGRQILGESPEPNTAGQARKRRRRSSKKRT